MINKTNRHPLQVGCNNEIENNINRRIIIGAGALLALTTDGVSAASVDLDGDCRPDGPAWKEVQSLKDN